MAKHSSIAIIIATHLEAEPFLETLKLEKLEGHFFSMYTNENEDISLVISGIGKVNAAIATSYCCSVFRPDWILNLGCAGATGPSYRIGGIYHVTKVVEHDRPHLRTAAPFVHMPEVLPGFEEATLATQDRAVIKADHRLEVSSVAHLVDMEGSAVVQAARRFGIPCILFKFVSDTPDRPFGEGDIIQCIRKHGKNFCSFVASTVIPSLKGR